MLERLLNTQEVADLLQVAPITLRKWRLLGRGPRFARLGANVRYQEVDVTAWVAARKTSSTSEARPPHGTAVAS